MNFFLKSFTLLTVFLLIGNQAEAGPFITNLWFGYTNTMSDKDCVERGKKVLEASNDVHSILPNTQYDVNLPTTFGSDVTWIASGKTDTTIMIRCIPNAGIVSITVTGDANYSSLSEVQQIAERLKLDF